MQQRTRVQVKAAQEALIRGTAHLTQALFFDELPGAGEEIDPPVEEEKEAWLVVGEATGKHGADVVVEIIGSTPMPVRGFSMGIGCDPSLLTLKSAEITTELANLVGATPSELTLVASQGKSGGIGDYLSIMCGFFKPQAGGVNLDAVIPHMTPMVRLNLEISTNLERIIGRISLDNRAGYYGRILKGPDGTSIRMLIDNHYVATPRKYVRTALQSGWVDVG